MLWTLNICLKYLYLTSLFPCDLSGLFPYRIHRLIQPASFLWKFLIFVNESQTAVDRFYLLSKPHTMLPTYLNKNVSKFAHILIILLPFHKNWRNEICTHIFSDYLTCNSLTTEKEVI